jgi:hypothetical protein
MAAIVVIFFLIKLALHVAIGAVALIVLYLIFAPGLGLPGIHSLYTHFHHQALTQVQIQEQKAKAKAERKAIARAESAVIGTVTSVVTQFSASRGHGNLSFTTK